MGVAGLLLEQSDTNAVILVVCGIVTGAQHVVDYAAQKLKCKEYENRKCGCFNKYMAHDVMLPFDQTRNLRQTATDAVCSGTVLLFNPLPLRQGSPDFLL